jgi:hypothetical protein
MFRTMSVTGSMMPGIVENSWSTPSILMEVTELPSIEDKRIRLREFPNVTP